MTYSSPGLIAILRSAIKRLENDSSGPDDPAVLRFKQRILRSIAQLDLSRTSLKAPDVLIPGTAHAPLAQSARPSAEAPPNAHDLSAQAAGPPPDSVTVLVAHRPRQHASGNDGSSSGNSSAA